MIEIIEGFDELKEWNKRDLYSIRIFALLKSYGTSYNFATFYRQIINGKITAIISMLDNDITLALDGDFDNAELVRFFCITGHASILCPSEFQFGAKYDEGAIALRNPTDEETSLTLTLNKLMGAPESLQGARRFNVYCKSLAETDETYSYNSKMELTMKPFESMIFKIAKER